MPQQPARRLILASASASRRALLAAAGVTFDVRPADIDEAEIKRGALAEGMSAEDAALRLADLKAVAVARREPEALVIGADQILVCDGVWFDKPSDVAAAREQLRALRGRRHELVTAVVCHHDGGRVWHDVATPCLVMRDFSEEFLEGYLAAEGRYASPARSVLTGWRAVVCNCSTRSKGTIPPFSVFPSCRCCRFFAGSACLLM